MYRFERRRVYFVTCRAGRWLRKIIAQVLAMARDTADRLGVAIV
jgi:hypothetical protein